MWGGIIYSGIDSLFLKGRGGWTFGIGAKGVSSLPPDRPLHCTSLLTASPFVEQLHGGVRRRTHRAGTHAHADRVSRVRAAAVDGPDDERRADGDEPRGGPARASACRANGGVQQAHGGRCHRTGVPRYRDVPESRDRRWLTRGAHACGSAGRRERDGRRGGRVVGRG